MGLHFLLYAFTINVICYAFVTMPVDQGQNLQLYISLLWMFNYILSTMLFFTLHPTPGWPNNPMSHSQWHGFVWWLDVWLDLIWDLNIYLQQPIRFIWEKQPICLKAWFRGDMALIWITAYRLLPAYFWPDWTFFGWSILFVSIW